jgi:polar amino acid transport system permease protein
MPSIEQSSRPIDKEIPRPSVVPINSVPVRRYGQILTAVILASLGAALVISLAQNENLDYSVVAQYLTAETVMKGLLVTFQLSITSMIIGIALGVLVAVAGMSSNRLMQALSALYVWFFRGVPLLVQILIWGNFGLLFSHLGVGIPFTNIVFFEVETNAVLTTFVAACIGLALHEAAYMAEVVRGGLMSVDMGQHEAATALGMTSGLAMRRIILPQAMRVIIPPTGNQFISLIKASSLVSVIAGGDLMTAVTDIGASNYRIIETLLVATFWYLVIVSVLSVGQRLLERRTSRGYVR